MKKLKPPGDRVFDSIRQASATLGIPVRVLQVAKDRGCPAFKSNRVYERELLEWLEKNPIQEEDDLKGEKLHEEIRKLRIANDAKEGRLVERAWVAERMQVAAGKLNAFRAKSEAEHPMLFSAASMDVPACRIVVRGIWDQITADIESLGKEFAE